MKTHDFVLAVNFTYILPGFLGSAASWFGHDEDFDGFAEVDCALDAALAGGQAVHTLVPRRFRGRLFTAAGAVGQKQPHLNLTGLCPGRMREINLRDQSHTSRSWRPEISRFGVDYVRLSIWIQHLHFDCCLWILYVFKSSIDV